MSVFRIIFRLLRTGLTWLLIAYWVVFVSYTIKNLVIGGPGAVEAWYWHISDVGGTLAHWSWAKFLAKQIAILLITLGFFLSGRRTPNRLSR